MVTSTLLVGGLFAAATAALQFALGHRLQSTSQAITGKLAWTAFTLWWYCLGAITLLGAARTLAGAFDSVPRAALLVSYDLTLILAALGLWGLLYYFAFLYSGREGLWQPLGLYMLVAYAALLAWLHTSSGAVIDVGRWEVAVEYTITGAAATWYIVAVALLLVPVLIGAIAYASLVVKAPERTQRVRILTVSGAFVVWFGAALVASALGINQTEGWQVASRVLGLSAAALVYVVYTPPKWLRRQGVHPPGN